MIKDAHGIMRRRIEWMKNFSMVLVISLALLMYTSVLKAMNWGVGVAGVYATGNFDFSSKPYLFPERKASGRIEKAGAALILDADPSINGQLNARLSFSIEKATLDSSEFIGSESFLCFNADIALGIGLVTWPVFRLWIGPELRFGIAEGEGKDFTRDVHATTIGFGALAGADMHLGDCCTLSLTAGARNEMFRSGSQFPTQNDLKGNAAYAYFSLAFLYKMKNAADMTSRSLSYARYPIY